MHPARILIVDDEVNQLTALADIVRRWGYEVETALNGVEALQVLSHFCADAMVTDLNMPELDGKGLLAELNKTACPPQAIILTAFGNLETAIELVHDLGAFWYLEKPLQMPALKMILARAVEKHQLAARAERLERELASHGVLGELIGSAPAMRELFHVLQQVAPTSATILITGESGTGKEVAARSIHQLSPRRTGPFFAMNCAALPEALIESELFGHEKGAFTGAAERRAGCFEVARGGTLFMDEIGEMPMSTQAKLLRVLEERKIRRLGAAKETEVDVRVVAATNRNLGECIAKGTFREDLYFRLNVFEVRMPALRERREDIPLLTETLLKTLNKKYDCRVTDISPEVESLFLNHEWPGNVRELRNVLERAVILAGSGTISCGYMPRGFAGVKVAAQPVVDSGAELNGHGVKLAAGMTVADAERALIEITLRHTAQNKTRAAEILGVSQKTLFNKLKEYAEA